MELMNGLKYARPGHGFVPNFNLTKKTDVNGQKEHELFTYMKSECPPAADRFRLPILYEPIYTSDVRWNFEKFLIGRDGHPVHRYASFIDPRTSQMLDEDIAAEIKKTFHADKYDHGKTDSVID
ncbi:hypothetical protein ACJMK2_022426 [Sinanodonta woodiana]|uniref:Glutathione peroxidase n=1 Tax=Sinanodonta woodiana TaxID=1069815 RepID=A0ABD3TJ54_SINWO